jgi:hypothetical protein
VGLGVGKVIVSLTGAGFSGVDGLVARVPCRRIALLFLLL